MRFRAPSETHPHTLELTPARHALRQAIARCDRARREADAAAIVVGRLNAITDEHAATAIVNSCRTREDHTDSHALAVVGRGFPEPSRQTLMQLHRGRTYRAPEALWGRSMRLVDGRCPPPRRPGRFGTPGGRRRAPWLRSA